MVLHSRDNIEPASACVRNIYRIALVTAGVAIQQFQVESPRRLRLVGATDSNRDIFAKLVVTIVFPIPGIAAAGVNARFSSKKVSTLLGQ